MINAHNHDMKANPKDGASVCVYCYSLVNKMHTESNIHCFLCLFITKCLPPQQRVTGKNEDVLIIIYDKRDNRNTSLKVGYALEVCLFILRDQNQEEMTSRDFWPEAAESLRIALWSPVLIQKSKARSFSANYVNIKLGRETNG